MVMFLNYFEFIISFGFTFAVVYGVLSASKVFGDPKEKHARGANLLVAIMIGLFASFSKAYITFLFQWMLYLIAIFVIVFILLIFRNLFGEEKNQEKEGVSWPMVVSVAILFLIFLGFYQSLPLPSGYLITSQDVALVIGIALIVLILVLGSQLKWQGKKKESND